MYKWSLILYSPILLHLVCVKCKSPSLNCKEWPSTFSKIWDAQVKLLRWSWNGQTCTKVLGVITWTVSNIENLVFFPLSLFLVTSRSKPRFFYLQFTNADYIQANYFTFVRLRYFFLLHECTISSTGDQICVSANHTYLTNLPLLSTGSISNWRGLWWGDLIVKVEEKRILLVSVAALKCCVQSVVDCNSFICLFMFMTVFVVLLLSIRAKLRKNIYYWSFWEWFFEKSQNVKITFVVSRQTGTAAVPWSTLNHTAELV